MKNVRSELGIKIEEAEINLKILKEKLKSFDLLEKEVTKLFKSEYFKIPQKDLRKHMIEFFDYANQCGLLDSNPKGETINFGISVKEVRELESKTQE